MHCLETCFTLIKYKCRILLLNQNGATPKRGNSKGNGYPEANDYSARILETMQTGVVFSIPNKSFPASTTWHARIYRSPGILPDINNRHHFNHPPRKRYLPGTDRPIEVFGNGYGEIANRHFDTFSGNEGAILCQWVYHAVGDRTLFISIP